MSSIQERIADARRALAQAGLSAQDAAIDAEVLARHALAWDRAQLVAEGRAPMPAGFDETYSKLIERRSTREPVAMITGHREFWGRDFEVSRDVLVPRPETELIVEAACERYADRHAVRRIVDVGTGTGCLAVALALEFPSARVVALDVSAAALAVAARNAAKHVGGRVTLVQADLLEAIAGPVDVVVANPPYVPSGVSLSPDIVRFEPAVALYGGEDGMRLLQRLIASARRCLAPDGVFVVEFGFGQDERVEALAAAAGWRRVDIKHDLQVIPRVAILSM